VSPYHHGISVAPEDEMSIIVMSTLVMVVVDVIFGGYRPMPHREILLTKPIERKA
jgi:hypothetical protein